MHSDRDIYMQSLSFVRGAIMMLEGAMSHKADRWDSTDIADARDAQAILKNLEDTFAKKLHDDKQEEVKEAN